MRDTLASQNQPDFRRHLLEGSERKRLVRDVARDSDIELRDVAFDLVPVADHAGSDRNIVHLRVPLDYRPLTFVVDD